MKIGYVFCRLAIVFMTTGFLLLYLLSSSGYSWSPAYQVTHTTTNATYPVAVSDSQNQIHVIWLNPPTSAEGENVFYSVYDNKTWRESINISKSKARALNARLVITSKDQLVAVWVELETQPQPHSRILYATKDRDHDWSSAKVLSPDGPTMVGPPALAVLGNEVHAVWASDTNNDQYGDTIYHAVWDGEIWTSPASLPLATGALDVADIAFDTTGRLHLVWDGNRISAPNNLDDYDIYYTVLDHGVWAVPVMVSNQGQHEYSFYPSLAVDKAGSVHVVWMEGYHHLIPSIFTFDAIYYQRLTRNQWLSEPVQLSTKKGVLFAKVAPASNGDVHFIWGNNVSENSGVFLFRLQYARWDGTTIYGPIQIADAPSPISGQSIGAFILPGSGLIDSSYPRLIWAGGDSAGISQIFYSEQTVIQVSYTDIIAPNNLADSPAIAGSSASDLHTVWSQGVTTSTIFYSHNNGERWSNPIPISPASMSSYFPKIATGPLYIPYVVWYGHDAESGDQIYYSHLVGTQWQTPTLISIGQDVAVNPDIAVDVQGEVYIVWDVPSNDSNSGIYYSHTTQHGQIWQSIERISTLGHAANHASIALDLTGLPHVVWYDREDQEIYYATRQENGWSSPENVSNTPPLFVGNTVTSQGPSIAIDRDGHIHVAWMDSVSRVRFDSVYYARREEGIWHRDTIMSRPDSVRDMDLASGHNVQVITGLDDAVHILWHDSTKGSLMQIYESNNLNSPTHAWSTPTILTHDAANAIRPSGYVDESGHLHLIWRGQQGSTQIFYEQIARFDWIKILNKLGEAMEDSLVYRNGNFIGKTDSQGLLLAPTLLLGDEIVALSPVAEYPSVRLDHQSFDEPGHNWAYRTYLTNWHYDANGERIGDHVSNLTGEQLIVVHPDSPLILLNLLVSLEWPANTEEVAEFKEALQSASAYLFDASNGQVAIGNVTIYANGEQWTSADIQVFAANYNRPYAGINGVRSALLAPVRVGRGWSGEVGPERDAPWNQPDGYRTLVHELGHYIFGLQDSYFLNQRDENHNLIGRVDAHCTDATLQHGGGDDTTNATLMDYQYNASEFSMRNTISWSPACLQTEQYYDNQKSDWETIQEVFTDTVKPLRWTIQTPVETGVLAGPMQFPLHDIPTIQAVSPATTTKTFVQVKGPSRSSQYAFVSLYIQKDTHWEAIDQGTTNSLGRITVLGAHDYDRLRVLSSDALYQGETILKAGITNTVSLSPVLVSTAQVHDIPPYYIRLLPRSDQHGVELQITGLDATATLSVELSLTGQEFLMSKPLVWDEQDSAFIARLTDAIQIFNGVGKLHIEGINRLGQPIYLTEQFVIFPASSDSMPDLTSPDGSFHLAISKPETVSPVDNLQFLVAQQSTFGASINETLLSPVYEVRLSGAKATFESPALITILPRSELINPSDRVEIARFDEATKEWRRLTTQWDDTNQVASTLTTETGFYRIVLTQDQAPVSSIYLPLVSK